MIAELVSALPELYQPIYAHPELSQAVSRRSDDRLTKLVPIHDALAQLLGRPLKVLDLGCAQGFFSLHLAERGAIVHGVDFLDKNITVCTALAGEHPRLAVSFETGRIEETIATLTADRYDLVLGLSVFHHVVHEKGADQVRTMLDQIAKNCGALVVELALRDEPLYWGKAQPHEPRALLEPVAFVHQIGRHGTHLSLIERPLFVASNRYWMLGDRAGRFESWTEDPHALALGVHQGSRRYFLGSDSIVKLYRFDYRGGAHNPADFLRESQFLAHPPAGFDVPKCFACGADDKHAWIAFERWPGRLLLDVLRDKASVDCRQIVLGVLEQLVMLESAGLFHNDVRTWNVLLAEDGSARLIDYGSISQEAEDCVWPRNIFLAFFIFVHEVATGSIEDPIPLRTVAISAQRLPPPYRAWAAAFWQLPQHEWSFTKMLDLFVGITSDAPADTEAPVTAIDNWMAAIEEGIDTLTRFSQPLARHFELEQHASHQTLEALQAAHARETALLASRAVEAELKAEQLEQQTEALQVRLAAESESQLRQVRQHIDKLQAECDALRASWSWRVTAPLRWGAGLASVNPSKALANGRQLVDVAANAVQRPLAEAMGVVLRNPALAYRVNQRILRHPALHERLLRIARHAGVLPGEPPRSALQASGCAGEYANLTPYAREVHDRLEAALRERQKEPA